jgi:hypothetical protein
MIYLQRKELEKNTTWLSLNHSLGKLGPADWIVVCTESLKVVDDIDIIDRLADYDYFLL